MANMQRPDVNGAHIGNGLYSHGPQAQRPETSKPLTLRESLPYSPQLTTLPFIPDLIPNPTLGYGSPALGTSDAFPLHEFEHLNREATTQGHLSKNGKQAVENLINELKPAQRTQYSFRSLAKLSASTSASASASSSTARAQSLTEDLTPVSKAFYDRVGDYFKATKPAAIGNYPTKGQSQTKEKPSPALQRSSSLSNHTINDSQADRTNSVKIEVAIPARNGFDPTSYIDPNAFVAPPEPIVNGVPNNRPQSTLPSLSPAPVSVSASRPTSVNDTPVDLKNTAFRIEIPTSKINRDEYLEVAETLETPNNFSRPKERHHFENNSQGIIGESLDQRQRVEAALSELRRRTETIDRATRAVFNMEPGFDHIVTLTSEQEPAMTAEEQKKMHAALQKVINIGGFHRVPVDDLSQVLRLGEASLKEALSLETHIDIEWDESAVMTWVHQLSNLDISLKAARTSLGILSGGRKERQLYSETVIENSVKVFQKATDEVVIPLVEMRNSGSSASIFKILTKYRKDISVVFVSCQKLLNLLSELVAKIQLSELAINTLEFVASNLIFVENAYYEKDSIVGVQKFDGIRSAAMDTLCRVFLVGKPEQRHGIINEILTSLSKLSGNKQSAKQYKLSDGGSIQPVSALVMRLVQASSIRPDRDSSQSRSEMLHREDVSDNESVDELQSSPKKSTTASAIKNEALAADQFDVAIQELGALDQPTTEDAQRNAMMVVNFLVQRAVGSSKTGETPFRNILDNCVDDFTTCLESIDWPSAELLLRCLMNQMVRMFEAEKSSAPAKNMALEILGNMSAAISRLSSQVKRVVNSSEGSDTDGMSQFLKDLANQIMDRQARPEQVVAWTGPFRAALGSLEARGAHDSHSVSAASFLMSTWAGRLRGYFENLQEDTERDQEFGRLAFRLRLMIEDRTWLTSQFEFKSVSDNQAKLSYAIILLGSPLCESFDRIFGILLSSMRSDQATVRSKSLKSINLVVETDPSILDRKTSMIYQVIDSARDQSTLVREGALTFMGKCIQLRPHLELSWAPHIMERVSDAGVSVRRRAIKLARDIYLRNRDGNLRSHIASGLLRRVTQDLDDGVRETARQLVEEIWFVPFYSMDDTAVFQTALVEHTSLIIRTVKTGSISDMLHKVLQSILKAEKKGPVGPFDVCAKLVSNMFSFINNPDSDDASVPSGRDSLHVLTIFANAEPKLFTFEQIRLLKPHLASSESAEEMAAFRAVVVILTSVLPQLSTVHTDFINELKAILLPKMGKMGDKAVLQEIGACVRVVLTLLGTVYPVVALTKSVLINLHKLQPPFKIPPENYKRLKLLSWLLGVLAQNFDLDSEIGQFKAVFKDFKGDSVARLMVDKLIPFTSNQEIEVRQIAIEGIAAVCHAWPRNYTLPKVWTLFQQAFQDQDRKLENTILLSFKEFLFNEEKRSEASSRSDGGEKKSLTVMGGTTFDDVASATTQRFLNDITRICLASQDAHAFLALEVLGSINRQGLTHPKETGVTLITLETSANPKISELAYQGHRALHEKHESTLEREYTKAVQSAFEYQRDVVKDTRGATMDPPQSKLHNMMDVLKISKLKNRQRFFEKICTMIDFDMATLDLDQETPHHLGFTRFVVENLAFFEYQTVGELQTAVHKIEQIVTGTGSSVAQAIDSEIFNVTVAAMGISEEAQIQQQLNGEEQQEPSPDIALSVDMSRLRQLGTASIILLLIWETRTYLRRLYGMGSHRHDSKAKALAKDLNKTPSKTQGIHWDKYWEEVSSLPDGLQSPQQLVKKCKAFVELMNVDKEFKVVEEDDSMGMDGPSTPSDGGDDGETQAGRKRKGAGTPSGRKKRARSADQGPRKRGRPRKNPVPEETMDGDSNGEWN